MVFMQYGILLAVRNRRFSTFNSNPLWGPRRNLAVPLGMIATALIAVTNLYGPGLRRVFGTAAIPGMFWGLPFAFAVGALSVDEGRKAIVRMYPKVCFGRVLGSGSISHRGVFYSLLLRRWLGRRDDASSYLLQFYIC
jgi:hypothetical protein